MAEATLTTKGQVTIPKAVRDHLKLDTGDRLDFVIAADGRVIMTPVTRNVRDLGGLLQRPGRSSTSVAAMDAGIAAHMRRRFGRRR